MKKVYFVLLLFVAVNIFSQSKEQRLDIIKDYNVQKLENISNRNSTEFFKLKKQAIEYAKKNNIPLRKVKNGVFMELMRLSPSGKPIYFQTYNYNAAKSSRASFLHTGGGMGLDVEGQGMIAFVWDGGHALYSHQEFQMNGSSKVFLGDTNNSADELNNNDDLLGMNHACHVMGTMIANGINAGAKGMAPQASGYTLNWDNDLGELPTVALYGMLVSNHSYGPNLSFLDSWEIGSYSYFSAQWDEITFNAPYWLPFCAAGNDGDDNSTNTDPNGGNGFYDKLYGKTTAKNTMVVAAAFDVNVNTDGDIISGGNIVSFSSQGPTDDFRIKPDITANGSDVFSTINRINLSSPSDNSYDSYNGTSMASPNAAGSALLLQQLYHQEDGVYMLAATLKGLILHTATDRFTIGPDYRFGWGYMNTKKAAETILNNNEVISENVLYDNQSYSFQVTASGSEPLLASISWTDKQGVINTGISNDHSSILVNDLDIRVTKGGTTYLPWKLTSVSTNAKGDNNVDPFERIDISASAGEVYTVTVSHKGTLDQGYQNYSIIVTGINSNTASVNNDVVSDFSIFPNPSYDGHIKVALNNADNLSIEIVDFLGKTVFNKSLSNSLIQEIDLSFLNKGMYFVTVSNNTIKTTKKLILK